MERHYIKCPHCKTRMRKTGKKEKDKEIRDGVWLYSIEYKCPNCENEYTYSERQKALSPGKL